MTLLLYHKRHKGIITLENVVSAKVIIPQKNPYVLRLRVDFQNGTHTLYQTELYKYKWK